MANELTRVVSKGIKDGEVKTADIADENVTLAKLEHGTSGNNGKFLRANNGADPTWETVSVPTLSDPIVTGDLEIADGGTVTHTITNWSDDITYVFAPTNCTIGTVNTSGQFVVTETGDHPSYTIKATTTSIGLGDSSVITKTLKTRLSAPTLSSPADSQTNTNVAYTITSTNANDNKLVLNIGSANFTYQSVSHGSGSKVGNTVEVTGFTTNNPVVTVQFTAEATYSVTAVAKDTTGTWGDSLASAADSITIQNTYTSGFLLIGGGGAANGAFGGGGGGGGYRSSWNSETSGGGASAESALTLTPGTVYTITIGAGGASERVNNSYLYGSVSGSDSTITASGFTTVTSNGGGVSDQTGGSGGGKSRYAGSGGAGTANQGYNGGTHTGGSGQDQVGAGGGGASAVGGNTSNKVAGNGGAGRASTITGSSTVRAGGGGGGIRLNATPGSGGSGGGGNGGNCANGDDGTANTGGGGGAGAYCHGSSGYTWGGNGGSGVCVLRMPTADYSGTQSGGSVSTNGSDTIIQWTSSGSYTA